MIEKYTRHVCWMSERGGFGEFGEVSRAAVARSLSAVRKSGIPTGGWIVTPIPGDSTEEGIEDTSEMSYAEQVDHFRNKVRDLFNPIYSDLLEQGCAPRYAAATIEYADRRYTEREFQSQPGICEKYDLSVRTLRKWYHKIENDVIDAISAGGMDTAYPTLFAQPDVSIRPLFKETFLDLLKDGWSVHTAAAAIEYIDRFYSERDTYSQSQIAEKHDISVITVPRRCEEIENDLIDILDESEETVADLGRSPPLATSNDTTDAECTDGTDGRGDSDGDSTTSNPDETPAPRTARRHHIAANGPPAVSSDLTMAEVLERIGELAGWQPYQSHGTEYDYRTNNERSTRSPHVTNQTFIDFTGADGELEAVSRLEREYGLDREADMQVNVNISLNKAGLLKLYTELLERRESENSGSGGQS